MQIFGYFNQFGYITYNYVHLIKYLIQFHDHIYILHIYKYHNGQPASSLDIKLVFLVQSTKLPMVGQVF